MYHCRKLVRNKIIDTYNKYMKLDFPKDELKPLSRILSSLDKEQYICYGIFEGEQLCGYAYFATLTENNKIYYLLDYFATVNGMRGNGIGSAFLKMLYNEINDVEIVLCEAENPLETTGDELILRNRRIDFYLKNHFIDTGVTASIFDVDFIILELDLGKSHSKDDIRTYYSKLYKSFLPDRLYNKFVVIQQ